VSQLLLGPVVTLQIEPGAIDALQVGVRRNSAPTPEVRREVAVENGDGILRLRVLVKTGWEQHVSPQIHVRSPKVREELGADLDVLHPLRVFRGADLRDYLVENDLDPATRLRIQGNSSRGGIEVPRLSCPLLAFAAIRRQTHRVPIGPSEGLVSVQYGLYRVLASWNQADPLHWKAEHSVTDDGFRPRVQPFYIDPKDLLACRPRGNLEPRLSLFPLGHNQDQSTVLRFRGKII